ncbi:uncharacterized protein RAG0_09613 [Rhynchosporium agropyri]|uniref:Secreted protein n=1 Tax=Rhynchosporium agropyri TaxID=914238 RepID=A0A1E1KW87_9HELO|nr:uncharacterized protein RAG0_09613 [Rhynchosporium agropyri]
MQFLFFLFLCLFLFSSFSSFSSSESLSCHVMLCHVVLFYSMPSARSGEGGAGMGREVECGLLVLVGCT